MRGRGEPSGGWGELLLVVAVAFGLPIYWSALAVLAPVVEPSFSDANLWGMVFYELLVLALLLPTLWFRGWTPQALGLQWQARDIGVGLALLAACLVATYPLNLLSDSVAAEVNPSMDAMVAGPLSAGVVVLVSLLNPIFEEVFVCAYVIRALERRHSPAFAVNVSVAIRASYHLYQGPVGAIGIVVVGLILGWWVARTGRLWPAIVAHAALDLLGLMVYV
ncbi:CPBP family intramembrane metalloprotease [Xanthomonas sp. A2111]|uniref:CPBP family intramembrane metalloprotease n=1 Tax=Xanthomonas hawaiiensis TaxID=3003247 RepID=A0ABU2I6B2_9XANT|nr:CPBP family intramembrane glutamic endopeptidase [Xanthomonas sp. A2111]MBO9829545.1 CPBP family intramembrane metalloprotease [Xanthomonas sp. A2111]MDS9993690.1 CPBP family intramembrane metalloprotease [Xanthomonas sp. A2111]